MSMQEHTQRCAASAMDGRTIFEGFFISQKDVGK